MAQDITEHLGTMALAAGALGAASFGIVDGLKLFPWIDLAGFERLFSSTSEGRKWPTTQKAALDPLLPALKIAYGSAVMEMLKAQYRSGRTKSDLPRTLRQGVRIGFGLMPTDQIAAAGTGLGINEDIAFLAAEALEIARRQRPPAAGETTTPIPAPTINEDQRAALARLETAIDARIDAALMLADTQYTTQTKMIATAVALVIAVFVGLSLGQSLVLCFVVGIAAVPLAPVAKDLATALQEAVKVFKGK
jgi:hypothetical protein